MSHVLLVGFMCSGKSTVGRIIAARLGRNFTDLDELIVSMVGRSILDIFSTQGEAAFRSTEREALFSLAGAPESVVGCGGGIVLDPANRATLRELGTVVWLRVSAARARERAGSVSGRPLMDGRCDSEVEDLLERREALYAEVADIEVDTDGLSAKEVAAQVIERLGRETK